MLAYFVIYLAMLHGDRLFGTPMDVEAKRLMCYYQQYL